MAKNRLLETYQLTLEKGWYWQKKENMSPWKVFSEYHFKERDFLWLLFRVHKLCLAKYLYFSKYLYSWQPFRVEPDRFISSSVVLDADWITCDGFRHKETKRIITITKLQQIRDKQVFINWIEVITGCPFPE